MQLPYSCSDAVPAALAPMAGITDQPTRDIARRWGASFAVAEMLTSDARLWSSRKSSQRLRFDGDDGPRIVQIAGADPAQMRDAAQRCVELGADVIDINMGCPAKKVCRRAAGSALLADEALVAAILAAVVGGVTVPVTLKFRTGPTRAHNNAIRIARLAEDTGIRCLALHGRSREDAYRGQAEHRTVRAVKQAVSIPVLANGDITNAADAERVLRDTGADGLLIGRGAQGRPWLFAQIRARLDHGHDLPSPAPSEQRDTILAHLAALHDFYGPQQGVRMARKHLGWYLARWPDGESLRRRLVRIDDSYAQLELTAQGLAERLPLTAAA